MADQRTGHQAAVDQRPEDRFKELVAIRQREQDVRAKIEAARAQAQQRLDAVDAEIKRRREQAMAQAKAEMDKARAQAVAGAESEARALLVRADEEAKGIEAAVRERQGALLEQLKQDLLSRR